MKTLYIIRHAKSSWNFDLNDIDRPLGSRGRRDVFKVGKALSKQMETPDLIISSPASRAFYTALYIADEWGYPEADIQLEKGLFHATSNEILTILSAQKDIDSIAIFGHNPGFTDLINHLSEKYLDNLPTAGVCIFELDIDDWSEIVNIKSNFDQLITPKKLRNSY